MVTYAGVAAVTGALRRLVSGRKALVILDEVHHAGDSLSWGEATRTAFEPAARRLSLTGTPFRSDVNPIPFISLRGGSRRRPALAGGLHLRLRRRAVGQHGAPRAVPGLLRPDDLAQLRGRPDERGRVRRRCRELASSAWRTALDPEGAWITQVLRDADRRLSEVRRHPRRRRPGAGQRPDRGPPYARRLRELTGQQATLVLSDDPAASGKIAAFAASGERWMVAVRMVSEGVDVPRLMVGVYATSASTPLYFAQAVGRFVRTRRPGETATVFLPSVPKLLAHAAELELERDHVLKRRNQDLAEWSELDEVERPERRDRERGPASSTSPARRRWIGSCSTAVCSTPRPCRWMPGRTSSWASPACSTPTRSPTCCGNGADRAPPQGGRRRRRLHCRVGERPALRAQHLCPRLRPAAGITPAAAHSEARRATGGPQPRRPTPPRCRPASRSCASARCAP